MGSIKTLDIYDLAEGDKGQEVFRLQRTLQQAPGITGIDVDGKFGPQTKAKVAQWQELNGLMKDGVAGPEVLRSLGIPVLPGVDLSAYQRDTEMSLVASAGAAWIYRKATEGTTHINREKGGKDPGDDVAYERDVLDALGLGLEAGFYHFGRPDTHPSAVDALREARHFINIIGRIRQTCQPTLDVEKGIKRGWGYNAQWIIDWCDYVEERLPESLLAEFGIPVKIEVIIYSARWAISLFIRKAKDGLLEQILRRRLWLADYDGYPDDEIAPWTEWTIHQHSGTGRVPGVHGKCDLNYLSGAGLGEIVIPAVEVKGCE